MDSDDDYIYTSNNESSHQSVSIKSETSEVELQSELYNNESVCYWSLSNNFETSAGQSQSEIFNMVIFDGTYFSLIVDKCTDKNTVAVCMKCPAKERKEVKGYARVTSNFLGHLKRKHGADTLEECKKYLNNKKGKIKKPNIAWTSKESSETSVSQECFDRNLINFFTNSMISLRTVEDPFFIKMIEDINSGIKIPGRCSLKNKIVKQYFEQIHDIRERLAAVKYVCTTVDIWSGKTRSFLGVTIHWVDTNFERRSAALACRRFKSTLTFDRIKDLLLETFAVFDLDPTKIVCSVTDNGSNFVKAFKTFGVNKTSLTDFDNDNESSLLDDSDGELDTDDLEETDGEIRQENEQHEQVENFHNYTQNSSLPFHFRCNAHTLHQIFSNDVQVLLNNKLTALGKIHSTVIEKCNELWSAAGRSNSAEIIYNILGHTLTRPGITRWNSFYDALKKILTIKHKYTQLARALGIKNPLQDAEFQYIDEYCQCSAPIANALDILQGDNLYYGILLPCLLALKKKLQKMTIQNLKYCEPLAAKYLQSVERRFEEFYSLSSEISKHAAIAALSYPRFKKRWLVCLTSTDQKKCITLFKSVITKEMFNDPETETKVQNAMSRRERAIDDDFFDFNSDSGSESESVDARKRADLIISNFFAEESSDLVLLQRYPVIRDVFIKYNTPMASSGSVERMFSFATLLNTPRSHTLSDELFEKRVIMKCNLNIM